MCLTHSFSLNLLRCLRTLLDAVDSPHFLTLVALIVSLLLPDLYRPNQGSHRSITISNPTAAIARLLVHYLCLGR
jgi:hypothetical protein